MIRGVEERKARGEGNDFIWGTMRGMGRGGRREGEGGCPDEDNGWMGGWRGEGAGSREQGVGMWS